MSIVFKLSLIAIGILAVLFVAFFLVLPMGLSRYDTHTRTEWLSIIHKELPPSASKSEMDASMRRHTTRYALDEKFDHRYAGFVAQTKFDKWAFDRKVRLSLKLNDQGQFGGAEVEVVYTFL